MRVQLAHHGVWTRHISKVHGRWTYLYRAVDKQGLTVDFLLSEHRDIAAAKRCFSRAIRRHSAPQSITPDGDPATHTALAELKKDGVLCQQTKVWTSKCLNNLIEQDHRRVQPSLYPMLGCKISRNATIAITGRELAQKLRKRQFNTSAVIVREGASVSHVWEAVLVG